MTPLIVYACEQMIYRYELPAYHENLPRLTTYLLQGKIKIEKKYNLHPMTHLDVISWLK